MPKKEDIGMVAKLIVKAISLVIYSLNFIAGTLFNPFRPTEINVFVICQVLGRSIMDMVGEEKIKIVSMNFRIF